MRYGYRRTHPAGSTTHIPRPWDQIGQVFLAGRDPSALPTTHPRAGRPTRLSTELAITGTSISKTRLHAQLDRHREATTITAAAEEEQHTASCASPTPSFVGSLASSEASDVYNDVHDLSRTLWEKAKYDAHMRDTIQSHLPSDHITDAYQLYDESIDALYRWHLPDPPPSILVRASHNLGAHQPRTRDRRALDPDVLQTPMDGMDPFLYLEDQKAVLKREEKKLLVARWAEVWENVRPPQPYWYEMRSADFHLEARRAIELDQSPERQHIEAHVRNQLVDLYRTVTMDGRVVNAARTFGRRY
ncbi:hypothetical protein DFJ77DRAFT_464247 [Powellomyces hirtus]|nr:hypothetical protein DFJ77DRAFT_464247 [Powellomyces hirtus]